MVAVRPGWFALCTHRVHKGSPVPADSVMALREGGKVLNVPLAREDEAQGGGDRVVAEALAGWGLRICSVSDRLPLQHSIWDEIEAGRVPDALAVAPAP